MSGWRPRTSPLIEHYAELNARLSPPEPPPPPPRWSETEEFVRWRYERVKMGKRAAEMCRSLGLKPRQRSARLDPAWTEGHSWSRYHTLSAMFSLMRTSIDETRRAQDGVTWMNR